MWKQNFQFLHIPFGLTCKLNFTVKKTKTVDKMKSLKVSPPTFFWEKKLKLSGNISCSI